MSLLSLLKTKDVSPSPPIPPVELWRCSHFFSFAAGENSQFVFRRGALPKLFPEFAVDFVLGCAEFLPLGAHLAKHAERHSWNALQIASLRDLLPELIEAGVLISRSHVSATCARSGSAFDVAPALSLIGFPTGGNRVAMLERALMSFHKNANQHGRAVEFLIADSSTEPAQREAFRTRLSQLHGAHAATIFYSGEEEKVRFAKALVKESGCSPEAVEFALFDPLGVGFACGANRNALLLHQAGKAFCSVDDDVVCRLAAPPDVKTGIALFSNCDPFSRSYFTNYASAYAEAKWVDVDFLATHEALLGRDLAAFSSVPLDLSQAGEELLRRIESPSVRVRATFSGHIGDPGIPTSIYYLYSEGKNRRRLTERSEAEYRAVLQGRSVMSMVQRPALGDASVSPGMAMGLDHRDLLPPFFPVLHAEDFVFGATLWQCCPGALLGHLSFAIQHEPPAGRPVLLPADLNFQRRAVIFEFAHILRRLVLGFHPPEGASAADRITALGHRFASYASIPTRDFQEHLRSEILAHESAKIWFLEQQLLNDSDSPEFWRSDLETYLTHVREAIQCENFEIPFDLQPGRSAKENLALMQTLIVRYGQLLEQWPAMVEAAKVLNDRGQTLSMLVG